MAHARSSSRPPVSLLLSLPLLSLSAGCVVQEHCTQDRDCYEGRCDEATGQCRDHECEVDEDCGGFPFTCEEHACSIDCSDEPISCADDMVPVCGSYCIDTYEASRPDATEESVGTDDSVAASRQGVLPWYSSTDVDSSVAAAACAAAGKRLCTQQEWKLVCETTERWTYSYGDDYAPAICNGIDTFCDCDGDGEPDADPYPHCRDECPTAFHATPTGAFPDCTNVFGAYDINGNVWEVVSSDDGIDHYCGGAYNCSDSEELHRCDFDGAVNGGFPSARGFRCCADPGAAR